MSAHSGHIVRCDVCKANSDTPPIKSCPECRRRKAELKVQKNQQKCHLHVKKIQTSWMKQMNLERDEKVQEAQRRRQKKEHDLETLRLEQQADPTLKNGMKVLFCRLKNALV